MYTNRTRTATGGATFAYVQYLHLGPEEARSGDGTVANVGVRLSGTCQCKECMQRFDTERALLLHVKFIHGDKVVRVIMLRQDDDTLIGTSVAGEELFCISDVVTTARSLQAHVAVALECQPLMVTLFDGGSELTDDDAIGDPSSIIIQHDTGLTPETLLD